MPNVAPPPMGVAVDKLPKLAVPKGYNVEVHAHCIGNAVENIQLGKADRMFAGGGEELDWTLSVLFDAMGAMSSKYNDTPTRASRACPVWPMRERVRWRSLASMTRRNPPMPCWPKRGCRRPKR